MPTYHVTTPGPAYTIEAASMDDALDAVERYLPCGPRSHRERAPREVMPSGRVIARTAVVTPTGRKVTGAAVVGPA